MGKFDELLEKKRLAEEALKAAQTEFSKAAKEMFKEWSLDLFNRYPTLNEICWCQYTPYFNDGDPCTFRSNHSDFQLNSDGNPWETEDEDFVNSPEYEKVEKEVSEFLSNFKSSDMERLFGDHCKVIITKSGVDVEEFYHD